MVMDSKYEEPPSVKALDEGYNQTYIIQERDFGLADDVGFEVLFRCGNWCYKGLVQFNDLKVNLEDVPIVIPVLQKQQGSLRYFCTAKSVPSSSDYYLPMRYMEETIDFVASELTSDAVEKELVKMSSVFPWVEDDDAATYFELAINNVPDYMRKIRVMASKTYTRNLVLISIYYNQHIYCVLQNGEGEQPLLDVKFPDVSKHNQGILLNSYNNSEYRKLTLWHNTSMTRSNKNSAIFGALSGKKSLPKLKTVDISSKDYEQTYVILKSESIQHNSSNHNFNNNFLSSYHDVMFRFGSWCYAGRVQLTSQLCLYDVPYVIPALRMQQSRLDYVSDVSSLPITSPFAFVLQYMKHCSASIERTLLESEEQIGDILQGIAKEDRVAAESSAFFEFSLDFPDEVVKKLRNVEMVVSKSYQASGLICITIFFNYAIYVSLLDNIAEKEHPLLDSRFPMLQRLPRDVSEEESGGERGDVCVGYALKNFEHGTPFWKELRRSTLWLTTDKEDAVSLVAEAKPASSSVSSSAATRMNRSSLPSSDKLSLYEDRNRDDEEGKEEEGRGFSPIMAEYQDGSRMSPPPSAAKTQLADTKSAGSNTGAPLPGLRQALPHHLPRLADPLANRLEAIRSAMGEEGMKAPWDMKGKPLGTLSALSSPGSS